MSTLTLKIDGTEATPLREVSQQGYNTEYRHRYADAILVAKVRHSSFKRAGRVLDRHNVDITYTKNATPVAPEVVTRCYVVVENEPGTPTVNIGYITKAMRELMARSAFTAAMVNFEPTVELDA